LRLRRSISFDYWHRNIDIYPKLPTAYMKLQSKFVWERFATAIKIDRIPLFNAFSPPQAGSSCSNIDQTDRSAASGPPEAEHLKIVSRQILIESLSEGPAFGQDNGYEP
jgi:hypothetical protein